ncbi:hypothetical protein EON82_17270 [bacterium]|nr:MAG: hypothetical protein EON82_17270 [bacterium]
MWLLYNLLLTLTAPFWVPWVLWRAHKRGEKPNWKERQGDYRESIPKKGDRPRLWVHTVSVGEFMASKPLLRELRAKLPQYEIVLSVTTSSGHQTARESEPGLYDYLVYLPIDVPRFTLAAMQRVRPDALIVLETELWMNLFWAAKTFDAKTFVVNARLSDRSFPKASKLRFFYSALLSMVDAVLAQTKSDAERFRALGARSVETTGNLKFDQAVDGVRNDTDWKTELNLDDRPVVVVGSLRAEEFAEVGQAIAGERSVHWIVAPRHLERTPELILELSKASTASIGRRSEGTHGDITVLDTYGELPKVYAVADVAIIGGSFAKVGMQNLIQPFAHGKPVLHGPYTQNFRDVADLGQRAGASIVCHDGGEAIRQLKLLIADPQKRDQMGQAARRLVEENIGASERMASIIAREVGSKRG